MAACTMFIGIFFLAMPLAIIGGSFQESWYKLDARARQLEEEHRRSEAGEDLVDEEADEDDDYFQDELEGVAHLKGATTTLKILAARASRNDPKSASVGRGGKYDDVARLVAEAAELLQEMASISEQSIIVKVQEAAANAAAKAAENSTQRVTNPMAEMDHPSSPFADDEMDNPMNAESDGDDVGSPDVEGE